MFTAQSRIQQAADGRQIVSVIFERESPEADSPTIEVIYEIQETTGGPFDGSTFVLTFLSATRTDTREPIRLSEDERRAVNSRAAEKVSEEND